MAQSPYESVSESCMPFLTVLYFPESLNIVTDFQYAERVVLHIETAKLTLDDSVLTSLFIQLQVFRNRNQPLYITHQILYRSTRPCSISNDEIDELEIGNGLEASEFCKKRQ